MLILLTLVTLAVEAVLQRVPMAGIVLSKIIVPVVDAGVLLGINDLANGGGLRFGCLLGAFQRRYWRFLPMVVACSLIVLLTQAAIATLFFGSGAADYVLMDHAHPELAGRDFLLTTILSGLLPVAMLALVVPLMLLNGVSPGRAFVSGISRVFVAWLSCGIFMLITIIALALALCASWTQILLLFVLPWSSASGYVSYRDLVTGEVVPHS